MVAWNIHRSFARRKTQHSLVDVIPMDFEDQIKKFGEYGIVERVTYPIVRVSGLPNVYNKEMVIFENNSRGEVFSLYEHHADILMVTREIPELGSRVARTGEYTSMSLCKEMLGHVVDPFGAFLEDYPTQRTDPQVRELDHVPVLIPERQIITEPFFTGYSMVDSIIPLGKGQRELIIGDEKTGKTSFVLGVTRSCVELGYIVVYAIIGGKRQEVTQVVDFLRQEKAFDRSVIVFSPCDIAPGSVFYTPYAAMTAAEYFSTYADVLVVMDDLTTHAKYYRELALLAGRYPGRDSYPGDVFYAHSRLLERAGVIKGQDDKTRSITCLGIGHTSDNDVTDYIISNLISITDGHLLFDRKELLKGRSPSINVGMSVSRVGKQTRDPLAQDIGRNAMNFLITKYEKTYALSHFGEEMSEESKQILAKGKLLYDFFNQSSSIGVPHEVQLLFVVMIMSGVFDDIHQDIQTLRDTYVSSYVSNKQTMAITASLQKHTNFSDMAEDIRSRKEIFLELCKVKRT